MSYVLSLIAEETAIALTPTILERAARFCEKNGANSSAWRWLHPKLAAECELDHATNDLAFLLRQEFASLPIDINVIENKERRKMVLVSDMDATAIEGETLDILSCFSPFKDKIDLLTRYSVEGKMSFTESLIERVALLQGIDLEALEKTHSQLRLSPGIKVLVATMRKHGALTGLVSGGFQFFTERVRKEIGFDIDIANKLEIEKGRLTGKLVPPIIDPEAKAKAVQTLATQRQLALSGTLAVGDGFNDIFMLKEAGLGIAYRGKKRIKDAITHQIDHADLRALLYLQGYHYDEFVLPED